MNTRFSKFINCLAVAVTCLMGSLSAHATIVRFQTNMGDFDVNLYDDTTPLTVTNFLTYLAADAYQNSFVHRSVPGFVVQGGGYTVNDSVFDKIDTPWSPKNEPKYSNIRGTIAMAKLGGDPDSATSQWFINLKNNASNLDQQNGGFTVFGQVIGDGMAVVDAIAALQIRNYGGALSDTPLRSLPATSTDFSEAPEDYLVIVQSITVIDDNINSAADLERPLRAKRKKKGGSIDWLVLLLAGGLVAQRRRSLR